MDEARRKRDDGVTPASSNIVNLVAPAVRADPKDASADPKKSEPIFSIKALSAWRPAVYEKRRDAWLLDSFLRHGDLTPISTSIGVNVSNVTNWRKGKKGIPAYLLQRLSEELSLDEAREELFFVYHRHETLVDQLITEVLMIQQKRRLPIDTKLLIHTVLSRIAQITPPVMPVTDPENLEIFMARNDYLARAPMLLSAIANSYANCNHADPPNFLTPHNFRMLFRYPASVLIGSLLSVKDDNFDGIGLRKLLLKNIRQAAGFSPSASSYHLHARGWALYMSAAYCEQRDRSFARNILAEKDLDLATKRQVLAGLATGEDGSHWRDRFVDEIVDDGPFQKRYRRVTVDFLGAHHRDSILPRDGVPESCRSVPRAVDALLRNLKPNTKVEHKEITLAMLVAVAEYCDESSYSSPAIQAQLRVVYHQQQRVPVAERSKAQQAFLTSWQGLVWDDAQEVLLVKPESSGRLQSVIGTVEVLLGELEHSAGVKQTDLCLAMLAAVADNCDISSFASPTVLKRLRAIYRQQMAVSVDARSKAQSAFLASWRRLVGEEAPVIPSGAVRSNRSRSAIVKRRRVIPRR